MLTEVVAQVATLLEHAFAPFVSATVIKFDALIQSVPHLNRLMPLAWHSWELL